MVKFEVCEIPLKKEKLGIIVNGETLLIPQAFQGLIKRRMMRSALQILSSFLAFPSIVIKCFKENEQEITAQEVESEIQALRAQLESLDPREFGEGLWKPKQHPMMGAKLLEGWAGKTAKEIRNMRKNE